MEWRNDRGLTLSGRVLAPRSLKTSLKRLFSPLFTANLMAIGVSADGVELMLMDAIVLSTRLMITGKTRVS